MNEPKIEIEILTLCECGEAFDKNDNSHPHSEWLCPHCYLLSLWSEEITKKKEMVKATR